MLVAAFSNSGVMSDNMLHNRYKSVMQLMKNRISPKSWSWPNWLMMTGANRGRVRGKGDRTTARLLM
jgi:hypothetical protein